MLTPWEDDPGRRRSGRSDVRTGGALADWPDRTCGSMRGLRRTRRRHRPGRHPRPAATTDLHGGAHAAGSFGYRSRSPLAKNGGCAQPCCSVEADLSVRSAPLDTQASTPDGTSRRSSFWNPSHVPQRSRRPSAVHRAGAGMSNGVSPSREPCGSSPNHPCKSDVSTGPPGSAPGESLGSIDPHDASSAKSSRWSLKGAPTSETRRPAPPVERRAAGGSHRRARCLLLGVLRQLEPVSLDQVPNGTGWFVGGRSRRASPTARSTGRIVVG